jgi:chromosome segregation ATPase
MSSAKESPDHFTELEGRIHRLIEEVRRVRAEKESALAGRDQARAEIRRLEERIDGLEKDRGRVRDRVESLLGKISDVDQRKKIG